MALILDNSISLPSWLERGIVDIFPSAKEGDSDQNLATRLTQAKKTNKPLRVKLGIDPTGKDIHLGHSILFRKLRAFQDAGHTAVLIIGDFTARIGDPTGKNKTRIQLKEEQVDENAKSYLEQLGRGKPPEISLLDFQTPGRLEIRRNSEWLSDLDLIKIIDLLSISTVGQMLAKEDFGNRYESGTPISLHEFLYPLLQGYDSVAVNADIELGGTDQKFNVAMGRDLQKYLGQSPQFGLLLPILVGLDGTQKMSKSIGNTVGLNEDPISMYSKLEKVPDALVSDYLTLLTDLNPASLLGTPRDIQKAMALSVTASHYGIEIAKAAQEDAAKLIAGSISQKDAEVPELSVSMIEFPVKAFYLLKEVGIFKTSSEARRQIQGGAVRIDGEKIPDPNFEFKDKIMINGKILQVGKKTFRRFNSYD